MILLYLSLAFSLIWIGTLIHAQKHRKNHYRWQDTVISKFISKDRTLQVGFLFLGVSIILLGFYFGGNALYMFIPAGIAAWFVMFTETFINNSKLHLAAAGTTYVGCILGQTIFAPTDFLLGLAVANICYAAYGYIIEDEVGDVERYLALGIIVWIGFLTFM